MSSSAVRMPDRPTDGASHAAALLRLSALLADGMHDLEQARGADVAPVTGLVRAAVQRLETAAVQVRDREAGNNVETRAARAEAMHQWLHELRTPVTSVAGWVCMLTYGPKEATRTRATAGVEWNASRLSELLRLRPP
jgi:signal transduction histidine kinase